MKTKAHVPVFLSSSIFKKRLFISINNMMRHNYEMYSIWCFDSVCTIKTNIFCFLSNEKVLIIILHLPLKEQIHILNFGW